MRSYQRIIMSLGYKIPLGFRNRLFRAIGLQIGEGSRIAKGFYVDRLEGVEIGTNCFFNHFVHLHNGANQNTKIIFGNNVFVGPDVSFVCASHDVGPQKQRAGANTYASIEVEDGVWIGARAIILPGVKIARGGVIGAGAVVTKSTDPDGLYLGVPAKRVRNFEY